MWLISKYGFASAVGHRDRPGWVLVRARDKKDLENFCLVAQSSAVPGFSEALIEHSPQADYRYRMTVRAGDWAELVKTLALEIDYPNFKNEVASLNPKRAAIYGDVWSELMRIQYPQARN